MSQKFLGKIGVGLSMVCALHCMATPLFIALLPMVSGQLSHNPVWEIILLSISFLIVGALNIIGFVRHHRNYAPIVYMFLGFSLIVSGHIVTSTWAEIILSLFGGFFVLLSVLVNNKRKREVQPCCDAH